MSITLYEDQAEFVDKLRTKLSSGVRSVLGVASPAFGKTVVAGYITGQARNKSDARVWFLVHRKNLLRQTSKSFWNAKIEHGLMSSGKRISQLPIQVGTIGTVYSRREQLTPPSILFVDEAHLAKGNMFETVIQWCRDAGSIVIGLTGTPERLDGKALGDVFDDMVEAKSTAWLIEQGRLSDYEIYTTPQLPDMSSVKKSGNDYNREQLAEVMDSSAIVGDAISHWKRYANGMRTVAYCVNVAHSQHTAAAFNAAGVPAVHVDADTTEKELKEACEGLACGRYLVLCNCELVIEGFDLSAQLDGADITLECCLLLRPTQSLARYLQMIFRALRRKPKAAVILDHAGCVWKHGLPDDPRDWSLEGRKKGKRKKPEEEAEADIKITSCEKCDHVFRKDKLNDRQIELRNQTGLLHCPKCDHGHEIKIREINVVEGELEKVDVEAARRERKQEQGSARTIGDLVRVGHSRGMNNPAAWAAITYAARQNRKPRPEEWSQAKAAYAQLMRAQGL